MKPITEYGFTEEEAKSIGLVVALFEQWEEEFIKEPDARLKALLRDVCENDGTSLLLLAGFLGGFDKGIEVCLKIDNAAK